MQKNVVGLAIAGIVLVVAGAYIVHLRTENEQLKVTVAKPAAAPAAARSDPALLPAPIGPDRALTAEQRKALLDKLDSRGGTTHPVWFATVPNNPEAASFQKQIQGVFEEAGWKVRANDAVPFPLKPGIFFFMADEEPPDHVQGIAAALDAAGIPATTGRGYRQFCEDKKKENPSWPGIELKPDQDFVLVFGRKPS